MSNDIFRLPFFTQESTSIFWSQKLSMTRFEICFFMKTQG